MDWKKAVQLHTYIIINPWSIAINREEDALFTFAFWLLCHSISLLNTKTSKRREIKDGRTNKILNYVARSRSFSIAPA